MRIASLVAAAVVGALAASSCSSGSGSTSGKTVQPGQACTASDKCLLGSTCNDDKCCYEGGSSSCKNSCDCCGDPGTTWVCNTGGGGRAGCCVPPGYPCKADEDCCANVFSDGAICKAGKCIGVAKGWKAQTCDGKTVDDGASSMGSSDDPCGAAGSWTFACAPSPTPCGGCGTIPGQTLTLTVSAAVAKSGGTVTVSNGTATVDAPLDLSSCSIDLGLSACNLSAGVIRFSASGSNVDGVYKCAMPTCTTCGANICPGTKE